MNKDVKVTSDASVHDKIVKAKPLEQAMDQKRGIVILVDHYCQPNKVSRGIAGLWFTMLKHQVIKCVLAGSVYQIVQPH